MELQQFISATLMQIVKGVEEAAKGIGCNTGDDDGKAVISPGSYQLKPDGIVGTYYDGQLPTVQMVDFDVVVHASEGTETAGGVGILVGPISLGSRGKSDSSSHSESRIKFRVPIVLPAGDENRIRPKKKVIRPSLRDLNI